VTGIWEVSNQVGKNYWTSKATIEVGKGLRSRNSSKFILTFQLQPEPPNCSETFLFQKKPSNFRLANLKLSNFTFLRAFPTT